MPATGVPGGAHRGRIGGDGVNDKRRQRLVDLLRTVEKAEELFQAEKSPEEQRLWALIRRRRDALARFDAAHPAAERGETR